MSSPFTRAVTIATSLAAGFLVCQSAQAAPQDRVILLRAEGNRSQYRVQIWNPSAKPITFSLGFNDQLFENEQALMAAVLSSTSCACEGLEQSNVKLPCAAYERVASALIHFAEITDQYGNSGWAKEPRLWFESPMLAINSFGFGTCGTFSDVLGKLWKSFGYDIRRRNMDGHAATEVKVGDRWLLFDSDLRGYFVGGGRILGIDELTEDPTLATDPAVMKPLPGVRECDFPHAGLEYYTNILMRSSSKLLEPTEVPAGPEDWRELTFTLPPGSHLTFPEEARSRCLFPEFADFNVGGHFGDLRDPPHQHAVVQIPAGSVSNIQNGLFPAFVSGEYCLTAVYGDSTEITDDFDQVDRFRFSRRFARQFTSLEAYTDMNINYMLTSNVVVQRDNQVRIHGDDDVQELDVRLIEQRPTVRPPATPCFELSTRTRIPVRAVSASSNGYGNVSLPTKLVDGSFLTTWGSELLETPEPQSIHLDLGAAKRIGGIRWAPDATYGMLSPSTVIVETSVNGKSYREAVRVTDYRPSSVDWLERDFEPRLAQYIRVIVTPVPHFLVPGYFQVMLSRIEILRPRRVAKSAATSVAPSRTP